MVAILQLYCGLLYSVSVWVGLRSVIMLLPGHNHLFFSICIQQWIIRTLCIRTVVYACSLELFQMGGSYNYIFEPRHEISNNVVCATSKGSNLIRSFASHLNIL